MIDADKELHVAFSRPKSDVVFYSYGVFLGGIVSGETDRYRYIIYNYGLVNGAVEPAASITASGESNSLELVFHKFKLMLLNRGWDTAMELEIEYAK